MQGGAIKLAFMSVIGFLLIEIGLTGKLGSILGAVIDPSSMQDTGGGSSSSGGSSGGTNGTGSTTKAPGTVKSWIDQAINLTGVPMSWEQPLITIAMKESGGDPKAVNNWDSNARAGHPSQGLMQTIPSTFQAYMVPGHSDILNPVDNAAAAINYIKARYGTVFQVPGIIALSQGRPYVGY